jgi:hypothetical protein
MWALRLKADLISVNLGASHLFIAVIGQRGSEFLPSLILVAAAHERPQNPKLNPGIGPFGGKLAPAGEPAPC